MHFHAQPAACTSNIGTWTQRYGDRRELLKFFRTTATAPELARRRGKHVENERLVREEVPIAFSFGGSSYAVMMATPSDLEDFAVGFCLNEGIIRSMGQIEGIEFVEDKLGIDVQITLEGELTSALLARRRSMAGPVGCGLCGIESIEQAVRAVPKIGPSLFSLTHGQIADATASLNSSQPLHQSTRAVHGAGFFVPGRGLLAVREDVGRHNALDKLGGAVVRSGTAPDKGAIVVTSRISVEMVQKAAMLGAPILIAISAPTALAVRTADEAGLTLVALARSEDFEIFTHAHRVSTAKIPLKKR